MNWNEDLRTLLAAFCFGYPFVMAWYWMAGGFLFQWFRERHEPMPDNPPALADYPFVSIMVPCHNEEKQAGSEQHQTRAPHRTILHISGIG